MHKYFITATDTDAGKTFVATAFVKALTRHNFKVAVYKPISAGCDVIDNTLVNEDAALLQKVANCNQSIHSINPIAFEEPIAPHIAALKTNSNISSSDVTEHYANVTKLNANIIVTEGAGGWRLPLSNGDFLSNFAKQTEQQVILVVNMKLGCLNHAILTYESILADNLDCVGWVANAYQEMPYLEENIQTLENLIKAPLLARFNNESSINEAAKKINLSVLNLF